MAELVDSQTVGPYTIDLRYTENAVPPMNRRGNGIAVPKYSLLIKDGEESESFAFWDSIHALENDTTPELHDVLSTVLDEALTVVAEFEGPHAPGFTNEEFVTEFGEFVDHYGYEDASEALRAWFEMNKNADRVLSILTEDELYDMADAAREDELDSFGMTA